MKGQTDSSQVNIMDQLIFNKYKPEQKLGEGSFGMIYIASNQSTGEKIALKMETKDQTQSLLETEAYILCHLKGYGIPGVKSFGYSHGYNVLVMELLGNSLENLFQTHHKHFSIKTVCMVGLQMLERIEWVHSHNIIHRDIKPDNFVIGLGEKSHIIHILDFGLSKKYWSSRTNKHLSFTVNKKLTGTARYASINALRGCEQSRRDDLEAIGYVMMYFLRGSLPWQGLKLGKREDKYRQIYEKKKITTAEELCSGFPSELVEYIKYTRNLEFEAKPDYKYLKGLLNNIMKNEDYEYDYFFDWCTYPPVIKEEFLPNTDENASDEGSFEKKQIDRNGEFNYNDYNNKNNSDTNKDNNDTAILSNDTKENERDEKNCKNENKGKKQKNKDKQCFIF